MKGLGRAVTRLSMEHAKLLTLMMVLSTLGLFAAAALPNFVPAFDFLPKLSVDSDAENMLAEDEPSRVMHHNIRERFGISDSIVLGVVNEKHPDGVFNVETLRKVYELTDYAKTLEGVVQSEVMSLSTVDDIKSEGPGQIRFSWLMEKPPTTPEAARYIRTRAMRIPMLFDTLVSRDGMVVAVYLPLTDKKYARDIMLKMQEKIDELGGGDEEFHFAGLPIAQMVFGVEMFTQMAISAPAAMLIIFLLMWFFFRKFVLIIAPMIVAMVAAITTMGLLVVTGHTIHIMSSMIPIFIMPIAVLNSIHIISDFFENYQETRDAKKTMMHVMDDLNSPMLFTSLTTTAGFGSLVFTPIPPVQVFGFFIAAGVMISWFWTITFLPAFVSLLSPKTLENFGRDKTKEDTEGALGAVFNKATYRYAYPILGVVLALVGLSAYGISKIKVNDNPTRWFEESHPIRQADTILNKHFGGTYDAYLTVMMADEKYTPEGYARELTGRADEQTKAVDAVFVTFGKSLSDRKVEDAEGYLDAISDEARAAKKKASEADVAGWSAVVDFLDEQYAVLEEAEEAALVPAPTPAPAVEGVVPAVAPAVAATPVPAFVASVFAKTLAAATAAHQTKVGTGYGKLKARIAETAAKKPADAAAFRAALTWADATVMERPAVNFVAQAAQFGEVLKDPKALKWLESFELALSHMEGVGKSNSLAGLTKTVYRDLRSGEEKDFQIPARRGMVAQVLEQFTSSHRKDDLWHFVTPDYRSAVVWLQLKSADNDKMMILMGEVDAWLRVNPPPLGLQHPTWSGMTYINVAWQDKMVSGMVEAFAGSFVIVFFMMVFLFRSILWGFLSMIPLTVTVGMCYGALGLLGKDYDMPVAVLSSLSLGLAVDYAIHFIARARALQKELGCWNVARKAIFAEPARAISRNVIVVGVGFLPLVLSPLVPYQTVGILIASILILAGAATLIILPSLIAILQRWLFKDQITDCGK